jgi:hypothetical protein
VEDEGRPFGVALRGEASNRPLLHWLKTVVVSEWEKAHLMCQVGIRKTMAVDVSKRTRMTSKPGFHFGLGKSLAGARLLARRCPAWRPRESGLLLSRGT